MKCFILGCFLLLGFSIKAQILEDFSDGNFNSNPVWTGDSSEFIINAQQQLQLNATASGTSYLSSTLALASLDSLEWRCFIQQDFSPSSSNYGRIYLVSDQANLEGPLNGYFLQFGEALSNDAVELFQQSGSTVSSIARCTNAGIASAFALGIRVTRSTAAEWKIYIDYNGGTSYSFEASGTDATFTSSSFFGVLCSYTTSNITKYFFDDFYNGPFQVDSIPPAPITATIITSTTLDVKFDEQLDAVSSQTVFNYFVNQQTGNPSLALLDATDKSLVHLTFANSFIPGPVYTLSLTDVSDQNSNTIDSVTINFLMPDTTRQNDIIINEVLFNPYTGGVDFVELYNRSAKVLDLKELVIANTVDSGSILDVEDITSTSFLLLPGEYVVLTEEPNYIRSTYTSAAISHFVDILNLPTYNDDEGVVVLMNKSDIEIDRVHYLDDYHFPLLNDDEGVSLERISPERPSSDSSNWHSAAASVGFATPALKNSQYSISSSDGSEVSIDPEVFSPDNDGFQDVVNIHYKFDKPGYTATVKIFSATGRPVLTLIKSELLGTEEGVWSWDGINDNNEKSPVGIYVIYIEAFESGGDTKEIKKTCVLGARL